MKIAINATIVDNKPTGLGMYAINVIWEMSKLTRGSDKLVVFTSCPEVFKGYNLETRKVFKWVQPKYGKIGGIFRFLWTQIVFPIELIRENPDLIYNTTHHGTLCKWRKVKVVTTIQSDVEVTFKFPSQHKLQYFYFKYFVPFLLSVSDKIITTSEHSRKKICDVYRIIPDKVVPIYNGYDKNLFNSSKCICTPILDKYHLKSSEYILTVGANYPHKNTESLVKAFKKAYLKMEKKLLLCIVGYKKGYIDSIRRQIGDDSLWKRLVLIPYAYQKELVCLYKNASMFVFPSFHESFGIPPLEAMACGCPVLVSNVASLPEVCGDAALYCNPHDVNDIAEKILMLATDEKLKEKLRQKGFERVKMFSWERAAEEHIKVFKEVLKKDKK